jgi:hypothetical protein
MRIEVVPGLKGSVRAKIAHSSFLFTGKAMVFHFGGYCLHKKALLPCYLFGTGVTQK